MALKMSLRSAPFCSPFVETPPSNCCAAWCPRVSWMPMRLLNAHYSASKKCWEMDWCAESTTLGLNASSFLKVNLFMLALWNWPRPLKQLRKMLPNYRCGGPHLSPSMLSQRHLMSYCKEKGHLAWVCKAKACVTSRSLDPVNTSAHQDKTKPSKKSNYVTKISNEKH